MAGLLEHKHFCEDAIPITPSKCYNEINEYSDTWKDSGSDSEDELLPKPVILKRCISFDTTVNVSLIPEAKEYDHIKDRIWYSEQELHSFVVREIEIRKKEIEEQKKELNAMRNEEIYTIMTS
jgi:hypothetical protein